MAWPSVFGNLKHANSWLLKSTIELIEMFKTSSALETTHVYLLLKKKYLKDIRISSVFQFENTRRNLWNTYSSIWKNKILIASNIAKLLCHIKKYIISTQKVLSPYNAILRRLHVFRMFFKFWSKWFKDIYKILKKCILGTESKT